MIASVQPILGALITPAMAYAGLGAAALPILIHLFNRRRFRRIRWAATDFLLEAERRNRRRTRLEEMILLALRCLAMLLIGMVLARWFVQPQSLVGSLGSAARADHIIVLDDSFSMAASSEKSSAVPSEAPSDGAARTVFDDARAAVQRVVDHIRQVAPEDSVTLLLASQPDRPVRSSTSISRVPPQSWADDIKATQPGSRAGNLPAAMKAVRELLDARQSAVRAAVYVVSDFQAIDWIGTAANASDSAKNGSAQVTVGPCAPLAGWAGRHRGLEVVLIDVGRAIPSNLSVASIQPEQSQSVVGVVGRYNVRIENFGTEPSQSGEMQVFMGDTALPPVPVPSLAPNQSTDVPVELAFGQEGSQRLAVQLAADALPVDNLRSCAVPVARALRLLIVNGKASPDPYQDEAFLLNVALRPEGPEFSGNETVTINENEFELADLADYHSILLLNVNRVTQEMAGRLERFAAEGGGVIFFLGDQVDGPLYNRLLHRGGEGILPAKLGDQITVPAEQAGARVVPSQGEAEQVLRLGNAAAPLLRDALVWQYFGTEQSPDSDTASAEPVATEPATTTTAPAGAQAGERPAPRVLLRLDDADRTPLLIQRPFGRGQVLLFSTSADKQWNNLADQPVYVVLMMELVQHVARPSDEARDQLVGEPIRLPIDPASYQTSALLKLPTYPSTPAVRLDARPNGETGQSVLEWTDTARPGLYAFDLQKTAGDTVTRQVAVNLDPRESDLRRADRNLLLASMGNLPASYVTGETLTDRTQAEARQELWPIILVLVVVVLMLEQTLAWWFGADRSWQRAVRWTTS